MTRAESLAILRLWARSPLKRDLWYEPTYAEAARFHGLAAVRAIRLIDTNETDHPAEHCACLVAVRAKARLAFRCALNAVGLKTL